THLRHGIEQPRIDLQPLGVNYLRASGNFDGRANRSNLAVAHDQSSVFNRRAREREDLGVCDRVDGRRLRLRACSRGGKQANKTKEVEEVKGRAETRGTSFSHRAPPRVAAPWAAVGVGVGAGGLGFSSGFFCGACFSSGFFSACFSFSVSAFLSFRISPRFAISFSRSK